MRKVISVSIFDGTSERNKDNFYWSCLIHVVRGYLTIFPDWELWVYHDSSLYYAIYGSVLLTLEEKGLIRLIYVRENELLCKAMLWRLSPVFDDSVDYLLCRDVDHVPTGRERAIVDEFVSSDKIVLGINDAWAHTIPLMGGMVGFKTKTLKKKLRANSLDELLNRHKNRFDFSLHGSDQKFLMDVVWPLLRHLAFIFSGFKRDDRVPYPSIVIHRNVSIKPVGGISDVLLEKSGNYCNFMGIASNLFPWEYTHFVDAHGNLDTIKIIREAEEKAFVDVYTDSRYASANSAINKKKVILSYTSNKDYLFYLPIVTLLWQKYVGFKPIVHLIGEINEWLTTPLDLFVVKEARKLGAEIHFLSRIDGYRDSTIAQLSRLYAACSMKYPDSYFLTSDADMLPLSREWFNRRQEGKTLDIKCPKCGVNKYPVCYIGASSVVWREFMNLKSDTEVSVKDQIEIQLKTDLKAGGDAFTEWCYDEELLSRKIREWNGHPSSCQIIIRKGCPPRDRVDRSCWPESLGDVTKYVDCHSVRPGYSGENWDKVRRLLALKLSAKDLSSIEQYRKSFTELLT